MESKKAKGFLLMILWISLMMMSMLGSSRGGRCGFEGIFTFGDSNSDTGGFFAAFPSQPLPNGITFFNKPTGRQSDGRLYIDFLAQALGFPFLNPYLKAIRSDFKHGANFATSGSTVLIPDTFGNGLSPFSLAIQLNQMKQFKAQVDEQSSSGQGQTNLPPKDIFGKSLYTIYIGQNDFTGKLGSIGMSGVQKFLPQVVSQIFSTVKELYWLGGRTFLVLNLGPMGCYPGYLLRLPHDRSGIDQHGCVISLNNAVNDYNKMLKAALEATRKELPGAQLVYVNIHDVLLEVFQRPTIHGLQYSTKACCGYGGAYNFSPDVFCGYSNWINGRRVDAKACRNPQKHVIWDGYHITEATSKILADAILNGSYSDPPLSFHKLCDIQAIN